MHIYPLITIVIIALALSVDAFVVSLAAGIAIKSMRISHVFRISIMFGFFQALMPVVGWFGGSLLNDYISNFGRYIASGIFFMIGLKMIFEGLYIKDSNDKRDYTSFKIILLLAIATSIDAFAVGVSFSLVHEAIFLPVIIIGSITFITSFIGMYIGNFTGRLLGEWVSIVGGVVLIGMAVKLIFNNTCL